MIDPPRRPVDRQFESEAQTTVVENFIARGQTKAADLPANEIRVRS
jgi:hypothetical protein